MITIEPLPAEATALFAETTAPPRLIAHLTLVHDVAVALTDWLTQIWPAVPCDVPAVLFGAATHDIGKTVVPIELTGPGSRHEQAGEKLLLSKGCSSGRARFARTHGGWDTPLSSLEDLLVALAGTVWKGKRNEDLETMVTQQLAVQSGIEQWEVWLSLDDALAKITANADRRLQWQSLWRV